jgi:molybdopterin-guanine dinucleotide biosynthesis protein A
MMPGVPVIGVCGPSGSGKTLLIERLVPRLAVRGLRVAVVKHCTHRIEADRPGKDTDRIFQAGADVLAAGPAESFARFHADQAPLDESLRRLAGACDVVLVEGSRDAAIPKIWLTREAADAWGRPEESLLVLAGAPEDCAAVEEAAWSVVERAHRERPVLAAVLIGGHSRRMGRPKHLLERDGATLLERAVAAARPHAAEALLAGASEAPAGLAELRRLPDAPGVRGPMAGVLAGLRWQPAARWLVLACDLPMVTLDAVAWLLAQARPGADAVMPAVSQEAPCEPLFALYEPTALRPIETAAARGEFSLRRALERARVLHPQPPPGLAPAWTNVNTPEEWGRL